MRRLLIPVGVLLAISLVAAGCGSSKKRTASATTPPAPVSSAGTVATKSSPVGTILVDGSGRTLYLFEKDKGGASSCGGACAAAWPPFVTASGANAGSGVTASKLTTITRPDGTKQVAYAGHPLYRFEGDASAGDLNGQSKHAFGAGWHVVSPSGEEIDKKAPSSSAGGAGSGGY
jgi:predicted lipoprotein with Yx(FWY)xxD motif